MIIHISGAPGSGKTTIGEWIKTNFKNVKVFDIDDLYWDFIGKREKKFDNINLFKKNFAKDMQSYVDKIIDKHQDTNIIFVGLNYPDPRIEYKEKETFVKPFKIDTKADYKFYIDLPAEQIVKQKIKRDLNEIIDDIDDFMEEHKKEKFEINLKEYYQEVLFWKKMFAKDGYDMVQPKDIKLFIKKQIGK